MGKNNTNTTDRSTSKDTHNRNEVAIQYLFAHLSQVTTALHKMTDQNEVQRIYIGGIQPPTLTVEMVQQRLQSTLSNQIEFISFDKSKSYTNPWGDDTQTFFFATVRSKDKDAETNAISPLEILARQYNNVKWKGCKLRVEKAKLHFLQRLEVEREEAARALQQEEDKTLALASDVIEKETTKEVTKTKRHLRIRRRFGEEAYAVDTKPVQTANQKEMHLSLKKQREKRKKHLEILIKSRRKRKYQGEEIEEIKKKEANLSLQSKVFLNRAIHIHFDDDYTEHILGRDVRSSILYSDEEEEQNSATVAVNGIQKDDDSSSSDGADSDSSVPSSSDEDIEEGQEYNKNYDSEDESVGKSLEDTDQKAILAKEKSKESKKSISTIESEVPQQKDSHERDTSDSDDSTSDESSQGYTWSESDDESGDEGIHTNEMKKFDYNESKHDDLDEFASSFNDASFASLKYGEIEYATEEDEDFQDVYISLEDDVKSMLGVAGKLFPELKNVAPESFDDNGDKVKHDAPVGWDSFGMMQRYDPTAASATNYEVNKDPVVEGKSSLEDDAPGKEAGSDASSSVVSESESGSDSGEKSQSSMSQKYDEKPVDSQNESDKEVDQNKEQVYEQKKLENIFQQERTGQGTTTFQMSSLFDQSAINNNNQNTSGGGFSFSFQSDLKPEDKNEEPSAIENKNDASEGNDHGRLSPTPSQIEETQEPDVMRLKKRRGLTFSKEELNVYVEKFYNANEGIDEILAIMADPKKSEAEKAKWDDERKILTNDWKRKQKQAQAYKNKRLKFRY